MSGSGYSSAYLSIEWKHFDRQTVSRRRGKYRLLIFDGYRSHLTRKFTCYCWEHNIIPFRLPSHSTHLLRPLDIGVFQPFKHWHHMHLHDAVRYGALEFTKQDFLAAFQRIHERTFARKAILSAWEKAGLLPFNPALVQGKMAAFESQPGQVALDRPKTPPPNPQPFQHTPNTQTHKTHMRYLQTRWMDSTCTEEPLTPSYYRALRRYEKYSSMKILQAQLMSEREVKKSRAKQERMRHKSGGNQHVQKKV